MDDLAIPFEPTLNDVVGINRNNKTLKSVKLSPKQNDAYDRLLQSYKPELDRDEEVSLEEYNNMAQQIVDTVLHIRKGQFLQLVGAGQDNKGLYVVMSVDACKEKVTRALFRMRQRLEVRQQRKQLGKGGAVRRQLPKRSSTLQKQQLAGGGATPSTGDDGMESSDEEQSKERSEKDEESDKENEKRRQEDEESDEEKEERSKEDEESDDENEESSEEDCIYPTTTVTSKAKSSDPQVIPFHPKPNDVVATKNQQWIRCHPGNVAYRELLDDYFPKFLQQNKQKKQRRKVDPPVAQEVVDVILQQRKGRFLKWKETNAKVCTVLHREECLHKVQKALLFMQSKVGTTQVAKSQQKKPPVKRSKVHGRKEVQSESSDDETNSSEAEESGEEDFLSPTMAAEPSDSQIIPFDPRPIDVVATKDRHYTTKHFGNVAYRKLLDIYFPDYLQQKSGGGSSVSEEVVDCILEHRGRFLKWKGHNVCTVMSREDCIANVQEAFQLMEGKLETSPTVKSPQKKCPVKKGKPQRTNLASGRHQNESSTCRGCNSSSDESSDNDRHNDNKPTKRRATTQHLGGERKKPAQAARRQSIESRKTASLLDGPRLDGLAPPSHLYGNVEDERCMRRWLNEYKLPQAVGDLLVKCGARNVNDVVLLIETRPDHLEEMAPLDLIKLRRAVRESSDGLHYI